MINLAFMGVDDSARNDLRMNGEDMDIRIRLVIVTAFRRDCCSSGKVSKPGSNWDAVYSTVECV